MKLWVLEEKGKSGLYQPLLWTATVELDGQRERLAHFQKVYPSINFRLSQYARKEDSMVKHHGKPAPPRKPQPKKPPKY